MPTLENIIGGAVHLTSNGYGAPVLVVAEGIETALAASVHFFDEPADVWATLSANGMEGLVIPPIYEKIIICGDNDASFTGQHAAYSLARRIRAGREAPEVRVAMPATAGLDMLDAVNGEGEVRYG